MNLNQLAEISNGRLVGPSMSTNSFSIDTRTIKPGEVFIALTGNNLDGHEFISEAMVKGASAAVVSKSIRVDIPHIIVKDTQKFMKDIADYNRNQFKGTVIGITGTNGKTSTKQILSNLLNGSDLCHKTIGNKNNQIGVPYSMLTLVDKYQYSVKNMGQVSYVSMQTFLSLHYELLKIDNQKHWEEVISAMQNVMQGNGTARNVGKDAPYRMAGKSGTVQVISIGQEEEYDEDNIEEKFRDHALFISFAPTESPKIAVSVIIENGQSGSQVAAPIAKAIMDKYLGY